jgi:AmmeMemoRadiSam system protein A
MTLQLSDEDRRVLCAIAREAIASELEKRSPAYPPATQGCGQVAGAFVTLNINGELRGCIGTMVGRAALGETVKAMAKEAAFGDPRFEPLSKEELSLIEIEITVLGPMKHIGSASEIELGVHGVYLTYHGRSAVFLPQVAPEWGWDVPTLLENLCRKAGVAPSAWKSPDVDLYVFEGLVFSEKDFR